VRNMTAYLQTLERMNIAYAVHDDRHLPKDPGALKLAIVPDPLALSDDAADWLLDFAQKGGTVFVEAGAGMHGPDTYFRFPNERPFYRKLGLVEDLARSVTRERRTIPAGAIGNPAAFEILLDQCECTFKPGQEGVIGLPPDNLPLLANRVTGRGRVIALGMVVGRRLFADDYPNLERLMASLTKTAEVSRPLAVTVKGAGFLTYRLGASQGRRLLMLQKLRRQQAGPDQDYRRDSACARPAVGLVWACRTHRGHERPQHNPHRDAQLRLCRAGMEGVIGARAMNNRRRRTTAGSVCALTVSK